MPINRELSIDSPKMTEHIKWLINNGCHGIVLFDATGATLSFSALERMKTLEKPIDAGIEPNHLIVGNRFTSLTDSVEVTQHALLAGCTTVLMMPPFYFKNPSTQGIVASFRHVFDQSTQANCG